MSVKKDREATLGEMFHVEHFINVTQNSSKSEKRLEDFEGKMGL